MVTNTNPACIDEHALLELIMQMAQSLTATRLDLAADTEFKRAGVDSIGLINLTTQIEEHFGFEFDADDLTATVLSTPRALSRCLLSKYLVV